MFGLCDATIYIPLIHVVVLDCKEQQPGQLGAQEVHKTVKTTFCFI